MARLQKLGRPEIAALKAESVRPILKAFAVAPETSKEQCTLTLKSVNDVLVSGVWNIDDLDDAKETQKHFSYLMRACHSGEPTKPSDHEKLHEADDHTPEEQDELSTGKFCIEYSIHPFPRTGVFNPIRTGGTFE